MCIVSIHSILWLVLKQLGWIDWSIVECPWSRTNRIGNGEFVFANIIESSIAFELLLTLPTTVDRGLCSQMEWTLLGKRFDRVELVSDFLVWLQLKHLLSFEFVDFIIYQLSLSPYHQNSLLSLLGKRPIAAIQPIDYVYHPFFFLQYEPILPSSTTHLLLRYIPYYSSHCFLNLSNRICIFLPFDLVVHFIWFLLK